MGTLLMAIRVVQEVTARGYRFTWEEENKEIDTAAHGRVVVVKGWQAVVQAQRGDTVSTIDIFPLPDKFTAAQAEFVKLTSFYPAYGPEARFPTPSKDYDKLPNYGRF